MSDVFSSFGHAILTAVLPSMATVIAGMLMLVVKRFLAKQGIELTEAQEDRLKAIVVEKVKAVEERSHREGLTGPEKHLAAVDAVVDAATADASIPNPTRAEASAKIDATLTEVRSVTPPGQPLKFDLRGQPMEGG